MWYILKTRKTEYGDYNIVGKNIERLRKEKGIKQNVKYRHAFWPCLRFFTVLRPTTFSGELTRVKQNLKYSRLTNCTEWFIIKKTDKRVERDK